MQILRDKVGQIYYTHGLFCASHPISILITLGGVVMFLCYPLLYTPLPGNVPVEYITPSRNYKPPPLSVKRRDKSFENTDVTSIPRWYMGSAVGYVQQLVVKTTVSPWEPAQHDPLDAMHSPLSKVFKILEDVDKFRHQHGGKETSLVDVCLRVSEPVGMKHTDKLLPEYACLVLSPANMWQKQRQQFLGDKEVLKTIYRRYNAALDTTPVLREMLFGLPWRQTGISRYFITNRQRTISFAITLVFKNYDESFVKGLREQLETVYPETAYNANNTEIQNIVHLHFKDINFYFEYTHLIVLYLVLLLYIYFSVQKIEMVKSKWGLALSAVVTVITSLLISVSVCSTVGMNTTLHGGEIFPYLVVLIGMENVLVMTKSVVSTSIELDVKYRVATGLSKEGWSITKNLIFELAVIMVGFFTFVPAIQEFCMFFLVGLLSDFLLQMVFFVTVLSLDIRRMELSDLHKNKQESGASSTDFVHHEPLFKCPFNTVMSLDKSKLHPRFTLSSGVRMLSTKGPQASPKVQHEARYHHQPESFLDLPRRLRLIYFWASTRVVQRFIMVCSVVWIVLIVYKTGLVHHFTNSTYSGNGTVIPQSPDDLERIIKLTEQTSSNDRSKVVLPFGLIWGGYDDDKGSVKHTDLESWRHLSPAHWTTMFGYYNMTIVGKYISILPSIHLSMVIPPQEAIQFRVPDYRDPRAHQPPKLSTMKPQVPTIDNSAADTTQSHVTSKTKDPVKKDPAKKDLGKKSEAEGDEVAVDGTKQQQATDADASDKARADVVSDAASAPEPDFYSEAYLKKYYPYIDPEQIKQFYPRSRSEFILTLSLAFLTVICITYFVMVLYRCLCSRKYSKWRASWNKVPKNANRNCYYKQIKESFPIVLRGHLQEIECVITNGSVIISSCLGGQLKVWDSVTGECLLTMMRKSATPPMRRKPCEGRNVEDSEADLYAEYHGNNHGNQTGDTLATTFTRDTSNDLGKVKVNQDDQPQIRLRKGAGGHEEKYGPSSPSAMTTARSDENFKNFPDLKSCIDVNFSRMYGNGGAGDATTTISASDRASNSGSSSDSCKARTESMASTIAEIGQNPTLCNRPSTVAQSIADSSRETCGSGPNSPQDKQWQQLSDLVNIEGQAQSRNIRGHGQSVKIGGQSVKGQGHSGKICDTPKSSIQFELESKSSQISDGSSVRFDLHSHNNDTPDQASLSKHYNHAPDRTEGSASDTKSYPMSAKGAASSATAAEASVINAYNFHTKFKEIYSDHERFWDEKDQPSSLDELDMKNRSKSWSEGDATLGDNSFNDSSSMELPPSSIWCLACRGNVVIAGCGNGKIEFWDLTSGALKCLYGENSSGVTCINFIGRCVIVARLDGSIDFLELETFQTPRLSTPLSPSSLSRKIKGHLRHLSHSRTGSDDIQLWDQALHCNLVQHTQAHHRPVSVLSTEGQRIVSGSQDFTLKVFHQDDYKCLYTLHGHTGAITCLYLDKCPPYAAVSGSADGTIRLWDLLTGHCVHKVGGHEGTVMSLICSNKFIISSGQDDKLCVWERKRGHLLYSVEMDISCGTTMAMLCNNFLVTGGQGSLYLWDVHKGELVRRVDLQQRNKIAFIHHIQAMDNSVIVCDYGNEIKVIRFPLVLEKRD